MEGKTKYSLAISGLALVIVLFILLRSITKDPYEVSSPSSRKSDNVIKKNVTNRKQQCDDISNGTENPKKDFNGSSSDISKVEMIARTGINFSRALRETASKLDFHDVPDMDDESPEVDHYGFNVGDDFHIKPNSPHSIPYKLRVWADRVELFSMEILNEISNGVFSKNSAAIVASRLRRIACIADYYIELAEKNDPKKQLSFRDIRKLAETVSADFKTWGDSLECFFGISLDVLNADDSESFNVESGKDSSIEGLDKTTGSAKQTAEKFSLEDEEKLKSKNKEEADRLRKENEEKLRREKEEAYKLKRENEEKLGREKEEAYMVKRENEEKLKRYNEEKLRREEEKGTDLRRENEEKLRKESEERLMRENEEKLKKEKEEADKLKRENERKLAKYNEERLRREKEEANKLREEKEKMQADGDEYSIPQKEQEDNTSDKIEHGFGNISEFTISINDLFSTPALAPGNENTAYKLATLNILAALPINAETRDRIVDADGVPLDVTVKDVLDSLHSKISSHSFDVNSYSWGDRSVNYILNLGLDRMGRKEKLHHLSDYLILLVVRNELANNEVFEIVEESIPRYLRHNESRNDISSLKMRINGGGLFGRFMTREVSVSRYAELIFLTFIGE